MPYGKGYRNEPSPGTPLNQRRQPAKQVSHVEVTGSAYSKSTAAKRYPRTEPGDGKLGTVASLPKP